jgi:hypothetical protein
MVHQSDRDPRPGDRALVICDLGPHPRRFIRPAAWMFATALAPCLCASEARPSDRGIQLRGIRPHHFRYQPHVRRETVAAGRGFAPARVLAPGAGPASPDIASSGVSEGGTGTRVRRRKWAGMKKLCFVDFAEGFAKVVPLFSEVGAELVALPLTLPSPRRRGEGVQAVDVSAFSRLRGEGARPSTSSGGG